LDTYIDRKISGKGSQDIGVNAELCKLILI